MRIYDHAEAGKELGIHASQFSTLRKRGWLPRGSVRAGNGRDFYLREELAKLKASLTNYRDNLRRPSA